MIRKSVLGAAAALSVLIAASPAQADPITFSSADVGKSITLDYNGFVDNTVVAGLGAATTFTLTSVAGNAYTFGYSLTNTTGSGVTSRVSSFAFDTNPDITSASSTGVFNYPVLNSNYPNGIGTVDVCFKGGASNSCAGNSGGVLTGDTGTGTLTLNFAAPVSALTLDNFFVRYQSISGAGNVSSASGAVTSTSTTSTSGGTPVPEPSMVILFGIGAAGLMFGRRRQSRRASANPAFA